MKTLECDRCGDIIKPCDNGLKCCGLYFCSQGCLNDYMYCDTYPIEQIDFERDGEEEETDDD